MNVRVLAILVLLTAAAIDLSGRLPPIAWTVGASVMSGIVAWWLRHRRRLRQSLAAPVTTPTPGTTASFDATASFVTTIANALTVAASLTAVATALLAWHASVITARLESRLPFERDGQVAHVIGTVDQLPSRSRYGMRVVFTVERCRWHAADEGNADCTSVQRVAVDWGPESPRDRQARDAHADALPWPQPGERWRFDVRLRTPRGAVNPAGADIEHRLLADGIGALGRASGRERIDEDAAAWRRPMEFTRARIRQALDDLWSRPERRDALSVPERARATQAAIALVSALSIGDQGALPPSAWEQYSRTGVSHLMAISGSHVTMLAAWAGWLTGWGWRLAIRHGRGRLFRCAVSVRRAMAVSTVALVVAFVYAMLAGWGIPSQRTCWMLLAAWFAQWRLRPSHAFDGVLIAVAIICLSDPLAVASPGFWLSFMAVCALVWAGQGTQTQGTATDGSAESHDAAGGGDAHDRVDVHVGRWKKAWRALHGRLAEPLRQQWVSTLAMVPLVGWLYSMTSLVSPLANAFAIPWVGLLLTPLSLAVALLAPVSPWLASRLFDVAQWAMGVFQHFLDRVDGLAMAAVSLPRPGALTMIAACIGVAWALAPRGVPGRRLALLAVVPMLFGSARHAPDDALRITTFDIGNGSAILVESGRDRLLFDTGRADHWGGDDAPRTAAARIIVPALRARGIDTIDTLAVSHLDIEHAGGAALVAAMLSPARFISTVDPRWLRVDRPRSSCAAGTTYALGRARIEALGPPETDDRGALRDVARDNGSGCVLRVVSAAGSVLLTGDLPARRDADLIRRARRMADGTRSTDDALRADVLVVPGQGSRQSTSAALLAAVRPSLAIVQSGATDRRRRLHDEVAGRIEAAGATILRTDLHGAVEILLRPGVEPLVRRWRLDEPPYWRVR